MDIEFHYYMTHLIALRAGFKKGDAYTIAYASQYTDDNDRPYEIEGEDTQYVNFISQTEDITEPQEVRLSIYPVFHFCPGSADEVHRLSPERKDGQSSPLNTIPDNINARQIFTDAMKSGNLYRIGIGTHMYADTFCHRDFTGSKDDFNWVRLKGFVEGIWSVIGPAIGHALAMHTPDVPPLIWEDTRLTPKDSVKRNKDQILKAAGNIFDFYCEYTKPGKNASSDRKRLLDDLGNAIGIEGDEDSTKDARYDNYETLLGTDYIKYKKDQWFNNAVEPLIVGETVGTSDTKYDYLWKGDYTKSDWFAFQEAVKQHYMVAEIIFKKAGIPIASYDVEQSLPSTNIPEDVF